MSPLARGTPPTVSARMHPRTVFCKRCGRPFFPASLPFHAVACEKRAPCDSQRRRLRRQPPPQLNRPGLWSPTGHATQLPLSPSGTAMSPIRQTRDSDPPPDEEEGANTCPCRTCGRSFSVDRLEVHERICSSLRQARPGESSHTCARHRWPVLFCAM